MGAFAARYRGSFMSANSAVQSVACGFGTAVGGMILEGGTGEPLRRFGMVGMLAAGATLASVTRTLKRSGGSDCVQHRGF